MSVTLPSAPPPVAPAAIGHTRTIARNSAWRGLEIGFSMFATLATSIAVARHYGPEALGYYSYVVWLTGATGLIGTVGLPLTTRKYMAEYLGGGQPALARAVFESTLRVQVLLSMALSAVGMFLVFTVADRTHVWMSAWVVLSIFPRTLALIPSQANVAAEDMMANVPGSVAGGMVQLTAILVTLMMNGDLLAIAIGMHLGYWVELALKLQSVLRWVRRVPAVPLPRELKRRMSAFSKQSLALLLLDMVVWDRSDIIFLKALSPDIRQVTFFAIAFSIVERLLTVPQVLGDAVGASLMAQFGRDHTRVSSMISTAVKYLLLCGVPLYVGVACVSRPAVALLYGARYAPVIPVLAALALFAVPKAIMPPGQTLLQAAEQQRFLVWWGCVCAALNVSLDLALVPAHGALGAAIANGTAQTAALLGVWVFVWQRFRLRLKAQPLVRILFCGAVMGVAVLTVTAFLPAPAGLGAGILVGAATFVVMLKWTAVFEQRDAERLRQLPSGAPVFLQTWLNGLLAWLAAPPERHTHASDVESP